jgi:hypothetical protein
MSVLFLLLSLLPFWGPSFGLNIQTPIPVLHMGPGFPCLVNRNVRRSYFASRANIWSQVSPNWPFAFRAAYVDTETAIVFLSGCSARIVYIV